MVERLEVFQGRSEDGLEWRRAGGVLEVDGASGERLLQEAPAHTGGAFAAAEANPKWWLLGAWYQFRGRARGWRWVSGGTGVTPDGWVTLVDGDGLPLLEVRESSPAPGVVSGEVRLVEGSGADWIRWRLKARPGERFLGFGERFNAVDQTGNTLFVWTEEGAFGLGERLGRMLDGVSWNPFPNGPTTAYKPMPFFISSLGYGLLLETSARVEYDVAASDPGVVDITVWDRSFNWVLFHGPEPAAVLERYTARTGRAGVPAGWVFAPWNDAIFGSGSVKAVAKKLRDAKIPTTAIWTEDWQGAYWLPPVGKKAGYVIFPLRYRIDRTLYPDAEAVADHLHDLGFRWLSYFFPYFVRGSREYREAREKGYLMKNPRGGVSKVFVLWLPYGHIDLTNPEAREWYMGLLEKNVEAGFDGWMADFGEYLPPDAVASTGETGLTLHNRIPLLWQKMHRELMDRLRPDGDYVFFCRSASVGSQAYAPVFWSGDSNTDFERYDGLPSNLPGLLSAGLSGLPLWGADIGGYMSHTSKTRDKELYFRWTEFAALLPVMRTHHGTHPRGNWSWDSDEETLGMFATYCRLHTALFPYLYGLAHEAAETGLPAARHLILHYPEDERSWGVEDQFLLGDRLLVAPVIERNARGRTVYFPPGRWVDYWTGDEVTGALGHYMGSPLDHLPLFVKASSIVPTLDLPVDSLAPVPAGSGLVGYGEALSTLRITLYGEGEDSLRLWDGTEVSMWRSGGAGGPELAGGRPRFAAGSAADEEATDALQPRGRRAEALMVASATGDAVKVVIEGADGEGLAGAGVTGGPRRERITFEWR